MMPHRHGVDNCILPLRRKGKQLDLGESRSPTQIVQQNLLPASHRLWAYVCAFGPGLVAIMAIVMIAKLMMAMVMMVMVMMAMVMMAMVMMVMVMMAMVMMAMVLVMVITVPVALRQVGWLHHHSQQGFHRLQAFYWPKLPHTQSLPLAKSFQWKTLLCSKCSSLKQAIKQSIKLAFKQALE
jgi:hypothetical protein